MATFQPDRDYLALARVIEAEAKAIRQGRVGEPYTDVVRRIMINATRLVRITPDDLEPDTP